MIDYDKLEADICKADIAARSVTNREDWGTCNFDTPVIKLDRASKSKLAELDWAVEPVGPGLWRGWYFVFVTLDGQGNLRTRMAQAAAKSLNESGWEASVFYEAD